MPAGMGFLRCMRLVPAPAEVGLACQAWGSRYTSVPEQLRLQAGLTAFGEALAGGWACRDLSDLVFTISRNTSQYIAHVLAAVDGSGAFSRSTARLQVMQRLAQGGVRLEDSAFCELVDWGATRGQRVL